MLQRIALLAIAAPRRIIAVAILVMVACGIFGIPVAKHLSAGGFQDPTSESAQATKLLVDKFGQGDMELLISVTDNQSADGVVVTSSLEAGLSGCDVYVVFSTPDASAQARLARERQ